MKRKSRKYLIGVIILAVMAIGMTGCASASQRKKQAAEALEEKYQEKFEVTACKNAGFMADYYVVQAYAKEYPDLLFQASVNTKTGNVMDSYVTKRLCDRISDKISQNIGALEADYYVFTESMLGDTVLTDPMVTLEEYMKDSPGNRFTVYLCIDQKDADAKNITNSLIGMMNGISGISGSVALYLPDSDLMAKIQEYVTSHDDTYNEFDKMVEEAYIGSVAFENGSFVLSEENLKKMAGDRL